MHVLHVYKDYPPVIGGIEHHIRALAEGQAAQGHEVTVLVTRPDPGPVTVDVEGGVRVVRARRLATVASAPISVSLAREVARLRPDVTHLHVPYPVGEAAWLAFGRRPMVVTYHSDIVRQRLLGKLWGPFLRRTLALADRVLATSPNYVESSPFLRRVRTKVAIVPLGVDVERFARFDDVAARAAAAARFGPQPRLVFVGRLRYYKGLHVLLRALVELPGVRLLVVGTGPLQAELAALALSLGVFDRVAWLPGVADDELASILAAGDLYVLPAVARSEAFGIALVEAMAAGLPAVTTEVGSGTSWVNQDGVTGRVVPPDDPRALAGAIRDVLADEDRRAAMGAAAEARARAEFSSARMIQRVGRIYDEVHRVDAARSDDATKGARGEAAGGMADYGGDDTAAATQGRLAR